MHFVKFSLAMAGYLFIYNYCPIAAFVVLCFLTWSATK